jgi:hypothetical protein
MIPLTGYPGKLSVRPDETISFHVSHQRSTVNNKPLSADIVRVICGDPNTDYGPGVVTEPVQSSEVECVQEPGPCQTQLGSHAEIPLPENFLSQSHGITLIVHIFPTLTARQKQTIASIRGFLDLFVDQDGRLSATFGTHSDASFASCAEPIPQSQWVKVWCTYDISAGEASLGYVFMEDNARRGVLVNPQKDYCVHKIDGSVGSSSLHNPLLVLAASLDEGKNAYRHHFNGRMESPQIWDKAFCNLMTSTIMDKVQATSSGISAVKYRLKQ